MLSLSDLIGKAKDFLSIEETPPSATEAVKRNSFDRDDWAKVRDVAPALQQAADDLALTVDYAEDFMGDLHAAFFKVEPSLRDAEEMKPSHVANRQVIEQMLQMPEVQNLRQHSAGDPYGSAMAMMAVQEVVQETLQRAQSAADDAAKEAEEQQAQRDQLAQDIADLTADLEANGDDPNGTGAGDLQAKLDQFGQLPAPSNGGAQQAAQNVVNGAEDKIRSAAKKGTEQLDEEQALASAFGVEPGELQMMPAGERIKLAAEFRGNRLAKFVKLLGQFKMVQQAESRRRVTNASDEVHDVTFSNHLERMVAGEYLNFADPNLETLMLLRYSEHQLVTTDVRGKERQGQGPIVAVCDESASMKATDVAGGSREAWSKALCLALLDQARRRRRDFVYIGFASSGEQHVIEFPGGQMDRAKVLLMTEHFFSGGTNFEEPLNLALKVIEERFEKAGKPRPDIVMLTDDQVGSLDKDFMHNWNRVKDKTSLKCYGIAIGCGYSGALDAISDNVRSITQLVSDPANVGDLFRTI